MGKIFIALLTMLCISCNTPDHPGNKVWAWMSGINPMTAAQWAHIGKNAGNGCDGANSMTAEQWDYYFKKSSEAGIDAILLECHGGYPKTPDDTTSFRDSAAIEIITSALPYAKKYHIELHAWIWTMNRTEMNLRKAHPEWYQINASGESCLDIKLYNREHYRWLCPSSSETLNYLKERVAELAEIEGLAGVHLDFIRYPDAILPYALHESRHVVQDRVYPLWDFCYCPVCRGRFKALSGMDPLDLEDPTSNEAWMQYRWDVLSYVAGELCLEIKKHGKTASVAVFATPEESKKLVRQDWAGFKNVDIFFPMIYHKFYGWDDERVLSATKEGVRALKAADTGGYLCSGLFVGHVPPERLQEFIQYTAEGGSRGICFFSVQEIDRIPGYWEAIRKRFGAQQHTNL